MTTIYRITIHNLLRDRHTNDVTCGEQVAWNAVEAATDNSVLAGVLAGFLIASAAVLFASGSRYVPHTIALLASGVPALAFSSYVFSAISGAIALDPERCAQVWSQNLVATAMLTIGGAVLVCGLGWLLISYCEDFENILLHRLKTDEKTDSEIKESADFQKIFVPRLELLVRLSGWLSAAAVTASAALLITVNVLYIKSGGYKSTWTTSFLIFIAVAAGMYVIVRSAYIITRRTESALISIRGKRTLPRRRLEALMAAMVALSAVIAPWLAGWSTPPCVAISATVTTAYIGGRSVYWKRWISERARRAARQPTGQNSSNKPTNERIHFWVGKLPQVTHNVAFLAVLGALFATLAMQRPMVDAIRVTATLFIGGFYPAVILLGLSYSVAAGREDYSIPNWLTNRFWTYVP